MSDPQLPELPELPVALRLNLPEAQKAGVFADGANLWHTPNYFVLDFVSLAAPRHPDRDPQTGQEVLVDEHEVVSRVRVLPEQLPNLIQGLQEQHQAWLSESAQQDLG